MKYFEWNIIYNYNGHTIDATSCHHHQHQYHHHGYYYLKVLVHLGGSKGKYHAETNKEVGALFKKMNLIQLVQLLKRGTVNIFGYVILFYEGAPEHR